MLRSLLVAALVGLLAPGLAHAAGSSPMIYVGNHSTSVTQQAIDDALPAFQTLIDRDLGPVWNVSATLTTDPAKAASAEMEIDLEDDSDACSLFGCALGYHDAASRPFAKVFARTSADFQQAWPLVFAHELEEMLVDPWVNRGALYQGRWWLVEIGDPVESGYYAYWIDGVPVSDFITPAWYGTSKGPYDFMRRLRRPGQLGRHGYASFWDPLHGGWSQIFADRH